MLHPKHARLLTLALLAACGDDGRVAVDAAPGSDFGPVDAAAIDAAASDGGELDGAAADDAGAGDAGPLDGGPTDFGPPLPDGGAECADGVITLDAVVSDTTVGAAELRDPNGDDCVGAFASGGERVYFFMAPVAAEYRVTVTPTSSGFDPMLYVQPSCDDASACLASAGLNGPGDPDSDTLTLTAGQTVLITVDTDFRMLGDTEGGPFDLEVERVL